MNEILHTRDEGCARSLIADSNSHSKDTRGRRDNRVRSGRGCRRVVSESEVFSQAEEASCAPHRQPCYKLLVSQLPSILRATLPRWARCGIEQAEDNKISREELPRRTRHCYVQPFTSGVTGELVEWQPDPGGDVPSHYRAAATPDALRGTPLIEVDAVEAQTLVREIVNAATPSLNIRVAPAYFLTDEMRAMIAPGVSFPDDLTLQDNAFFRRVSIAHGEQTTIPQPINRMPIEGLHISNESVIRLKQAGVTTVGMLLALEEEQIGEYLNEETLWEVYCALLTQGFLPTPSGVLPTMRPGIPPRRPIFEEFYFYSSDVVYEDEERGQLIMVYASVFPDRLDGLRSGPVHTIWLSQQQIEQSMHWERGLDQLDTHEMRERVNAHALARGATHPSVVPSDGVAWQRTREEHEMEERYNLVPFRHELFVSDEDLHGDEARGLSPTRNILRVLDHYLHHPELLPVGDRLPVRVLEEMYYWIREDRRRQFDDLPSPASPTIVMHEVYVLRRQKVQDRAGKLVLQDVPELVGYRLITGVLASTPVPSDLIIEPQQGKPQFPAPERPIQPCRTPNYVPIQQAA